MQQMMASMKVSVVAAAGGGWVRTRTTAHTSSALLTLTSLAPRRTRTFGCTRRFASDECCVVEEHAWHRLWRDGGRAGVGR